MSEVLDHLVGPPAGAAFIVSEPLLKTLYSPIGFSEELPRRTTDTGQSDDFLGAVVLGGIEHIDAELKGQPDQVRRLFRA